MLDRCADGQSHESTFIPLVVLFRQFQAGLAAHQAIEQSIGKIKGSLKESCIQVSPWWAASKLPNGSPNPLPSARVAVLWLSIPRPEKLALALTKLQELQEVEAVIEGRSFGIQPCDRPQASPSDQCAGTQVSCDSFGGQLPAEEAIVGIVDDGIAFAHRRFRRQAAAGAGWSPRIKWFWDQGQTGTHANASPGVGFGAEWSGSHTAQPVAGVIGNLLQQCTHAGLVDEDEVYRFSGHTQAGERARHGTHVLDVAAGAEPHEAGSAIIAVQLPQAIAAHPGDPTVQLNLLEGLAYIIWRAHSMPDPDPSKPRPLVVNLSYGIFDGPHDGTLLLEQVMDRITSAVRAIRPFAIVMAAGNHAQERCRAKVELDGNFNRTVSLGWSIPPDSDSPAYAELWTDTPGGGVTFELQSPGSDIWTSNGVEPQDPSVAAWASITPFLATPGGRWRALLKVMPTFGAAAGAVLAPSGRWVIRVTCNEPAVVDAWIRRNDTPFGFKGRSRQSRFLDPDHERFDKFGRLLEEDPAPPSLVRREGSLNGLATGHETIVIGASRRSAMGYILPTAYTAHGLDGGKSPMMVAPGDHSLARPGILAAGTRSGSVVCLNGTSVAAPAVTRALALQLVNTRQIPAALASISRRLAPSGRFLRTGGWELARGPEKPEALR